jgi:hypothetical protein
MPITDVQWVLGHAPLTMTQIYPNPVPEGVIASVLAHHARRVGEQNPGASHRYGIGTAAISPLFVGRVVRPERTGTESLATAAVADPRYKPSSPYTRYRSCWTGFPRVGSS